MKRLLLALAASLFASFAFAACDVDYSVQVTYDKQADTDVVNVRSYKAISPEAYTRISTAMNKAGDEAEKAAAKMKGKGPGADYTMILTQTGTCPLVPGKDKPLEFADLSWHNVTRLAKLLNGHDSALFDGFDDANAKRGLGKKPK